SRRQLPTSHRACDACAAVAEHITASATSPPVQSMRRAMARSSSEGWDTGWHAAHAQAQHYATKRALQRRKPRCGERKTAQVRQKEREARCASRTDVIRAPGACGNAAAVVQDRPPAAWQDRGGNDAGHY